MLLYEVLVVDRTDTVFNPVWRQGCYAMPIAVRLGAVSSVYGWNLGISQVGSAWSYESIVVSHIVFSGLLVLASQWHWAYSDLDIFISSSSGNLVLDLSRIFGIHLSLSSILCFTYGIAHLSGISGPGTQTSDAYGLLGSIRGVKPSYALTGLTFSSYGVVTANHIVAGAFGFIISIWHIAVRPQPSLYLALAMGNLEVVLSSSISAVFFIGLIVSSSMWYISVTTPIELLGPSRYQWDNAYFALDIGSRLDGTSSIVSGSIWDQVPDKLVLYDYIGCNPAKGGIFRSGPMDKGDGVAQNWIGHPYFELGTLALTVRRMPAFFETFPVLMIDQGGTLRSDIPFRRAESLYSIEQCKVTVFFVGGVLNGSETNTPAVVKAYTRKAQFGETFTFNKKGVSGDGVFRTNVINGRHSTCSTIIGQGGFGHLWHASRSLFRDLWTGVTVETQRSVKMGESMVEHINS